MVKCPVCGSENVINNTIDYSEKFFKKILISTIVCNSCGFKHSDILTEEKGESVEINFFVEEKEDLNILVVKSSKCSIEIPEIGLEITPGPYSEGYITTIEGILERIENFLYEHMHLFEQEKVKKIMEKIKEMRNGNLKFHLILKDSSGISKIFSKKAKELKNTK
ncbi:MAG: ZPR1 zinc finger domain-containing protein [Candidatus Aenigmarchaeota archaeon]|nr:ZPR1 zinc finger domain-containing protein [Candidatus Aenigmarchaeota archaeon]MDW8149242.1 ZPR1 zinc finger domain-containing protein [Candidatus Aenigmarchaeota archaeon]